MAVFLVNQCTFAKLPSQINNDQQTNSVSVSQNGVQQPNNVVTGNSSMGMGLPNSNICGLKFDSLFELIHHIEDNHINEVEYQQSSLPANSPFYNGVQHHPMHHPHLQHPHHPNHHHHGLHQQPMQTIYSDNQRVQNIINGHWLPTSCVLRIFNSTHKPMKKEILGGDNPIGSPATPMFSQQATPQPQHPSQQLTPQPSPHQTLVQQHPSQQMTPQPQHQQPLSVEMVAPSPQICTPTPMDANNSHHVLLASPKIMGNNMYHGSPYHVAAQHGGPITTTQQMNMTAVTLSGQTVNQSLGNGQQLVSVNNSIQVNQPIQIQQGTQLQPNQALQAQQIMHIHQHQHPRLQAQPQMVAQQPQPQVIQTRMQVNQMQPQTGQLQGQLQAQPQLRPQHQIQPQTVIQSAIQTQLQPQMQNQTAHLIQQQHIQQNNQIQLQSQTQPQLQTQPMQQPQGQTMTTIQPQQPNTPQSIQHKQGQQTQVTSQHPSTTSNSTSTTTTTTTTNTQPKQQSQQSAAKTGSAAKPFKCAECGRSYKTQKNFNIHLANHRQKDTDTKPNSADLNSSNNTTNKSQ